MAWRWRVAAEDGGLSAHLSYLCGREPNESETVMAGQNFLDARFLLEVEGELAMLVLEIL